MSISENALGGRVGVSHAPTAIMLAQPPSPVVPATSPTTGPGVTSTGEIISLLGLVVLTIAALGGAWRAGVFRRRSIDGPNRIAPDEPLSALWMIALLTLFVWFGSLVVLGTMRQLQSGDRATTAPATTTSAVPEVQELTPRELVVFNTVSTVVALVAILLATWFIRRRGFERLGLTVPQFRAGLRQGLIAALIVVPLTYSASYLAESFWDAIHYQHPNEHDLLRALGELSDPGLKILIIVSAVLLAPAFEELMFRGYIQTALLAALWRMFTRRPAPPNATILDSVALSPSPGTPGDGWGGGLHPGMSPELAPTPALPRITGGGSAEGLSTPTPKSTPTPAPIPVPPPTPTPAPWMRWVAILITSIAFAAVHEQLWMMSPIFFLSLCLGYAYERTGKLWVPMVVHATFNATSTVLFLVSRHV